MYNSKFYSFIQLDRKNHINVVNRFLKPQADNRILEIGCGRGYTLKRVQKFAPQAIGIDVNGEAIRRGVVSGLYEMDAQELEFPDESFDKVYSFHTIEHLPDVRKALNEIERVLAPQGKALLVYPAEPIRGLLAGFAATALLKNPLRGRDIHLHKLSPKIIEALIIDSRLRHLESKFSLFTPQYFTLLEKSVANER